MQAPTQSPVTKRTSLWSSSWVPVFTSLFFFKLCLWRNMWVKKKRRSLRETFYKVMRRGSRASISWVSHTENSMLLLKHFGIKHSPTGVLRYNAAHPLGSLNESLTLTPPPPSPSFLHVWIAKSFATILSSLTFSFLSYLFSLFHLLPFMSPLKQKSASQTSVGQ